MKRKSLEHIDSPLANALEVVGEWWTLLIVQSVRDGSHRFEPIQRELKIARNILTDRLNTLVATGVLDRRLYQDKPERYEYHLTDMGHDLSRALDEMSSWGQRWLA